MDTTGSDQNKSSSLGPATTTPVAKTSFSRSDFERPRSNSNELPSLNRSNSYGRPSLSKSVGGGRGRSSTTSSKNSSKTTSDSVKKPPNIKIVNPNYFITSNLQPNPSPSPITTDLFNGNSRYFGNDNGDSSVKKNPKLRKEAIAALKKLYSKDFSTNTTDSTTTRDSSSSNRNGTDDSLLTHSTMNSIRNVATNLTTTGLSKLRLGLIYLGIVLVVFCGGLDQTMSSTISDRVSRDLATGSNRLSTLTWITGAYMISLNALFPLYGKLSDLLGRKTMLSLALLSFVLGSLICSLSSTSLTFILGRAVVGIGSSGMIVIPFIIIADLNLNNISLRSLFLSLTSLALIFSNVLGPLLAGVFEDNLNFRFCYYLTFCLSLVCGTFVLLVLPNNINQIYGNQSINADDDGGSVLIKLSRVDWFGTLSLILAVVLISIGLNWGGKDFSWLSPQVLSCILCGLLSVCIFLYIENYRAIEPILPPKIFFKSSTSPYQQKASRLPRFITRLNISFIASAFSAFVNGIVVSPLLVHWIPFYKMLHSNLVLKSVENSTHLLPFLLCNGIMSTLSGVIGHRTRFKFVEMLRLGAFLITTMTLVIAIRAPQLKSWEELTYLILLGIGVGLTGQTSLVASQASVDPKDVAIATSVSGFAFSMGGVLGLPIAGAILDNAMPPSIATDHSSLKSGIDSDSYNVKVLLAYQKMFFSLVPFAIIGFLTCLMIRSRKVEKNLQNNSFTKSHNFQYSGSIISPVTPYFKDRFSLDEIQNSNGGAASNSLNPNGHLARLNSHLDNIEEEKV